jgi:hypothetical protein
MRFGFITKVYLIPTGLFAEYVDRRADSWISPFCRVNVNIDFVITLLVESHIKQYNCQYKEQAKYWQKLKSPP